MRDLSQMRVLLDIAALLAVDTLDLIDGDSDDEANGDELDGNGSEDDFMFHGGDMSGGAGCPIADPDGCEHDGREQDDGE